MKQPDCYVCDKSYHKWTTYYSMGKQEMQRAHDLYLLRDYPRDVIDLYARGQADIDYEKDDDAIYRQIAKGRKQLEAALGEYPRLHMTSCEWNDFRSDWRKWLSNAKDGQQHAQGNPDV